MPMAAEDKREPEEVTDSRCRLSHPLEPEVLPGVPNSIDSMASKWLRGACGFVDIIVHVAHRCSVLVPGHLVLSNNPQVVIRTQGVELEQLSGIVFVGTSVDVQIVVQIEQHINRTFLLH